MDSKTSTFTFIVTGLFGKTKKTAIIKTLTSTQLRAVQEAIRNILKGNCPIDAKLKNKVGAPQKHNSSTCHKSVNSSAATAAFDKTQSNFASDPEACDRLFIEDEIAISLVISEPGFL